MSGEPQLAQNLPYAGFAVPHMTQYTAPTWRSVMMVLLRLAPNSMREPS